MLYTMVIIMQWNSVYAGIICLSLYPKQKIQAVIQMQICKLVQFPVRICLVFSAALFKTEKVIKVFGKLELAQILYCE